MSMLIAMMMLAAVGNGVDPGVDSDDAAHRADKARTEQLNRAAAARVDRRDKANGDAQDRYDDARRAYQRQLDQWRRRVAACEQGRYEACDAG